MKKFSFFTTMILVVLFNTAKADEGMWLPYMLNGQTLKEMQAEGCKLTAEEIFNLNKASLKDAIVQFGNGCTGELISAEGLLLTNHHCGLGQIQEHSSPANDYLTNGFWAANREAELTNPGLSVSFLTKVEDVTAKVLQEVNEKMTYEQRNQIIDSTIRVMLANAKKDVKRNIKIQILPFYHENQYIMFTYDVYEDVRLVGTPPWGIGKFGADTDNWTWPRHKGDFCLFRVYTAPDGSPAKYSKENIPMKSKHFLPISLKGVKEGDYAMILGYPGSTDRYSASQGVELIINETGPSIIKCRSEKLTVYRKHMDANQETFIKYASKQASVSNYWKYYIGQVKQLQRNKVVSQKQELENQFSKWVNADPNRKTQYGKVLSDFSDAYGTLAKYEKAKIYHREAGFRGGEAIAFSTRFRIINKSIIAKENIETIRKNISYYKSDADKYFKDYDMPTDQEATIVLLSLFYKDIPAEMLPSLVASQGKKGFEKYVKGMFEKSVFTSQERFNKWMEKPYDLSKDPVFKLAENIFDSYYRLLDLIEPAANQCENANRLFMKGLMEMQKDKNFYPDANFTMRLTYGTVKSYQPADAVDYSFETTLKGVMEKEIPGNWEFDVPKKLKTLYETKDYGKYADKENQLVVNFITTNDITGGNSGSPVIDGNGNLIGLAFDGNWEAMSGDISFEQKVQRTICMDARYLIFVIDKFANAQNIVKELKIIE